MKKFMALLTAIVLLFAVAIPVSAVDVGCEDGCGGYIVLVSSQTQGGWNCKDHGGPSNCISGMKINMYACSSGCNGTGYSGYNYTCNATPPHTIQGAGLTSGKCVNY